MGLWEQHVVPRLVDWSLGSRLIDRLRAQACEGLAGTVVELGAGSAANAGFFPDAVEHVWAVEPNAVARKRAAKRLADHPAPLEFVGLDGQQLPLEDASVDAALSTFTLCTIPDADAALSEVHRVLRPGGTLHFVEHGRAPDEKVVQWQDRLNGIQQRVAGGCNLNRPIADLVEHAGLTVEQLTADYLPGMPKPFAYAYRGVARRPAAR